MSQSAQQALDAVRLDTDAISDSAGERPVVDLAGDADPSQLDAFQGNATAEVRAGKARSAREIHQDRGENDIFPAAAAETLSARRTLSVRAPSAGGGGNAPSLPDEAIAGLDQSLGPALSARIAEQQAEYADGREAFERDSEQTRIDADERIGELDEDARQRQIAEQDRARADVARSREQWQAELETTERDYAERAEGATAEHREQIDEERREGQENAERHLDDAEERVAREKQQAAREAEEKKKDAEEESGGFWGWVKSAASALIDGLKKAVNFIYDNLRKAVKLIFEAAKALALAAIELARMAIVGLIKAYGAVLKGLVSVVFAAFPNIARKINGYIDRAVNAAVNVVNTVADALRTAVTAVLDFLANTIDTLLGLVQDIYNGIFTVIGMIIRGEFGELMERIGYLVDAAKTMPEQFETAAYEELLGGDLDKPLSPRELDQAGVTPPGVESAPGGEPASPESLPRSPWTTDNVGVDDVEWNMELSPEVSAEIAERAGGDGTVEFGTSTEPSRSMESVLAEVSGPQQEGEVGETTTYPDDGLTPRRRAEIKWELMKQGLEHWWAENRAAVIAGAIAAIVGVIALLIVTGGSILTVVGPIMAVLGPLFIGVTIATIGERVRDYVTKAWDHDIRGGGKSLAKALAAGAIELISWLTFKAGGALLKGAKAAAKGVSRLARGAARGVAKIVRAGVGFVIKQGKVLFKGIARTGIGRRVARLRELGEQLLQRLRFKKFRITIANRRFRLEGHINPWILLADGSIEEWSVERGARVGERVDIPGRRAPGIVVGVKTQTFVKGVKVPRSSQAVENLRGLSRRRRIELHQELRGAKSDADIRRVLDAASETGRHARQLREKMVALGKQASPGDHAHHIVPSTHPRAAEARRILDDVGVHFNDGPNGAFVSQALHRPLHTHKYIDKVTDMLRRARSKPQVIKILQKIEADILAGRSV